VEIYKSTLLRYLESTGFESYSEEIIKAENSLKTLKGLIKYGMGILDQTIKQILASYSSTAILTNGDDAVFIEIFEEREPDNASILQNGIIPILQHSRIEYHSIFDKVRLPVKVEAFVKSEAMSLMSNSTGQLNKLQETNRKRNIKDLNMLHMSNYSTKLRLILQREVMIDSIIDLLGGNYEGFKKANKTDSDCIRESLRLEDPDFESKFETLKERTLNNDYIGILMNILKKTLKTVKFSPSEIKFDILYLSVFQKKRTHSHTIKGSKPLTLEFSTVFKVEYADKANETSIFKVFDPSRNQINPKLLIHLDGLQVASILSGQTLSNDSSDDDRGNTKTLEGGEGIETIEMKLDVINSISISLLQVLDELYCYSHLWHCYPRNEFIPHVKSHGFIFNDLFSSLSANELTAEMFSTNMPLIEGFYLELEGFEDVQPDVLRSLDNDTKRKAFKYSFKILRHIHYAGILHNDLKESNVLLSIKNEEIFVRMIDFGNSIVIYDSKAESKEVGTTAESKTESQIMHPNSASSEKTFTSESSAGLKRRRLDRNHQMNIFSFSNDGRTAEQLIDQLRKDYDALRQVMKLKLNIFQIYDDAKMDKLAREDYVHMKNQLQTGPVERSE
jgi:hypothetical protein